MTSRKTPVAIAGLLFLWGCSNTTTPALGQSSGSASGSSSGSTSGNASGSTASGSNGNSGSVVASGSASGATPSSGSSGSSAGKDAGAAPDAGSDAGIPVDTSNSVLQRNKHASRDGNFYQPLLTRANAMKMMPDATFNTNATYKGDDMWASPVYLEQGPGGKGIYVAATIGNSVIAFDETGTQVWKRSFGLAPQATGLPCGGANPFGILGTPAIDSTPSPADGLGTIYVTAAIATPNLMMIDHYETHALSAMDGSERAGGWPVKLDSSLVATNDGMSLPFTPNDLDERAALLLVNGFLYVAFGGPQGDCGPYHGFLVAIDITNPANVSGWATRGAGGAIWSAGGPSSDGNGVLVTTGNANYGGMFGPPPMYGDSEGVIRVSGMPLTRSDEYYPARWQTMDTGDEDMGATNPMVMQVPGATPSSYVVALSKDAHLYLLDSNNLGMMGGQIVDLTLASTDQSGRTSPVTYRTGTTSYVALTIDRGAMGCPATPAINPGLPVLMGLSVTPGNSPAVTVTPVWCVTVGGQAWPPMPTIGNRSSSPIVTTTDGTSEPIVWVMGSNTTITNPLGTNASLLYAVDGVSGAVLYSGGNCTSTGTGPSGVHQFTTPIAVKGHIVAGAGQHLCSWSSQ